MEMIKNLTENDIEKILHEANLSSMRSTEEYQFGRFEEHLEREKKGLEYFERVLYVAESFFSTIKQQFVNIKIQQFRVGKDYSSHVPAIIIIVDQISSEFIPNIRDIARSFEEVIWSNTQCYIWTKDNKDLDQRLLEIDFPFSRKKI